MQQIDQRLIDLMVLVEDVFENDVGLGFHSVDELSHTSGVDAQFTVLQDGLVEDDALCYFQVVFAVLLVLQLEAKFQQLVVEPPQDARHAAPFVPDQFYAAVRSEQVVVQSIGDILSLGEDLVGLVACEIGDGGVVEKLVEQLLDVLLQVVGQFAHAGQ